MSNNLFKGVVKLSQEQFDTLKSTGTLTVNGETITYSPDDTVYAVGDNISEQVSNNTSDIEQLQTDISSLETELTNKLDKNQGVENVGKFLGIDNTGDTVPLDLPKTGIIQLIGTEDNPVNLYTDTKIGQVYSVSGWVWRKPNGTRNSDKFQFPFIDGSDDVFFFKRCSSSVGTITNLYLSSFGLGGSNGNSGTSIAFNTNPNHSSYVLGEIVSYTNFSTPSFNGLGAQAKQVSLVYAPITSGTAGQILQSNGANEAPTWVDPSTISGESNFRTLSGTETEPIDIMTDIEFGYLYLCTGYIHLSKQSTSATNLGTSSALIYKQNDPPAGGIALIKIYDYIFSDSSSGGSLLAYVGTSTTIRIFNGAIYDYLYAVSPSAINGLTNTRPVIYVPTTAGTSGQVLKSTGGEPEWADLEAGGTTVTVGTEQVGTLTFTSDPQTQLNTLSNNKVDKEDGKELSTNDYTTAEKDKLSGIEAGAQVNPTSLSELAEDSTHRLVTDAEKSTWNLKSDFSGSYNDLTNKPTIPSDNTQLTNGAGYATQTEVNNAVATKTAVNVNGMLQQTLNFDSDPQTQIDNLTNKGIAVYIDEGVTSITQEQLEILQADDSNYIVYGQHVFYVSQIASNNSIRLYINITSGIELRCIYITSGGHLEVRKLDLSYILENNEVMTSIITQKVSSFTNNYVRLGNNLLIQWGHAHCDRDTNMTLTFDYPFADANYSIVVMNGDSSAWAAYLNGFKLEGSAAGGSGIGKTSTGCTISQYNYANDFEWIAIGRWE